MLTVANQLTLLRMGLAPLLVVLVLARARWGGPSACSWWRALTDLLDGLIARLGGQQTTLGAMLDPVADKVLLTLGVHRPDLGRGRWPPRIPVWLTVVILSRDAIIIMSVAIVNLTLGRRIFYPSLLGKLSTAAPDPHRRGRAARERERGGGRGAARAVRPHPRAHRRERPPLRVPGLDARPRPAAPGDRVIEETIVHCPSCGEPVALDIDTSAGDEQEYVEDCAGVLPADGRVRALPAGRAALDQHQRGLSGDDLPISAAWGTGGGDRPAAVGMKRAGDGRRPRPPRRRREPRPPTS